MLQGFRLITATFPDHPQVSKLVVVPLKTIYINRTAADDANIIRLVQDRSERIPRVIQDR